MTETGLVCQSRRANPSELASLDKSKAIAS